MRSTETQRRFRKQMAQIEKKNKGQSESPYDYYLHRGKNRGFKKTGSRVAGTVAVFLIIVLVAWIYNNREGADPTPLPIANPGPVPATHGERLVPAGEATLLQSLGRYNIQMGEAMEAIGAYHATPHNQRDLHGYRQALLNGMSVSAEIESGIDGLQVPSELSGLAQIAKECTLHSGQACSSYLDYLATGKSSDIEKGNHFLSTAGQRSTDYQAELCRYLKENGYKHEVADGGRVQYWHSR